MFAPPYLSRPSSLSDTDRVVHSEAIHGGRVYETVRWPYLGFRSPVVKLNFDDDLISASRYIGMWLGNTYGIAVADSRQEIGPLNMETQ
jgi:hypothetical protein